ncbi:hypothetical protein Q9S36_24840 [Microbacterium sp. ARD31]|uniref:hypothetical protein n=1 Tax=Microbacterium sp. ARD31 TaxID=2962576 RepID=UPI0028817970|nr:hypothetical protein [Microbacterium sp. ARD31]MDT0183420.1 hypothetical protein [Microbacterium sp. ARD31]
MTWASIIASSRGGAARRPILPKSSEMEAEQGVEMAAVLDDSGYSTRARRRRSGR